MNYKPYNALPWCISNPDGDNDTQVIQKREANPSAVCMGATEGDADYIVHVANAYPRLVAALREMRAAVTEYRHLCGASARMIRAEDSALTLLADIGEEK